MSAAAANESQAKAHDTKADAEPLRRNGIASKEPSITFIPANFVRRTALQSHEHFLVAGDPCHRPLVKNTKVAAVVREWASERSSYPLAIILLWLTPLFLV